MPDAAGESAGLLIEREEELLQCDSALRTAEHGAGSILIVEGPAGTGKTSLLDAIARRSRHRRLTSLPATAGERERDLEWSVVRSLFAGVVENLSAVSRAEVEHGRARPAVPLLTGFGASEPPPDHGALVYALYWLVVGLAEEAPLLLSIDDAHWADGASLRWLEYLGARISEVGIVLAVGRRTDAAPVELQALAAHAWSRVLRPAPLSGQGCARVLAGALGREPDQAFADACRELTAGNPFLLGALVNWLRARGVEPTRAAVARLAEARPDEVETWALLRLDGLPPPAPDVARAAAILGRQATLRRVSMLTGIEPGDVADAAAASHRVGILEPTVEVPASDAAGAGCVRFAQPLLASVVHDSIPPFLRTALHTEAARLLQRERVSAPAIAQHLMFTEPAGDAAAVDVLRAAAAEAMASGFPVLAAARLTRALAEPPVAEAVAAVLHELGRAETAAALPDSLAHLERAYAQADSPTRRGLVVEDLAPALMSHMRLEESARLVRATLSELYAEAGGLRGDLMLRLGARSM